MTSNRHGCELTRARRVVLALGLSILTSSAFGQRTSQRWRIGFLTLDTPESDAGKISLQKLPEQLAKLGYEQGKNLTIDWRFANGRAADLPRLAADLVATRVDVIVARTNGPIRAAMDATREIPIVMLNGNFPVETGLVRSLASPGGNVTGTAFSGEETFVKQLQLLKEIVPGARRVGVLVSAQATGELERYTKAALDRAFQRLGVGVRYYEVENPEDVAAVLDRMFADGVDAFFYSGAPVLRTRATLIIDFLLKRRLPSMSGIARFADLGGLANYAPDIDEFYQRIASYVQRILSGTKPTDLPIQQPSRYEFVVNLRTAAALGLKVPPAILAGASRLIE